MLRIALLIAWSALSICFALIVGASVYLGSGLAPANRTADAITAIVLILVFIGWLQATYLLVTRLDLIRGGRNGGA